VITYLYHTRQALQERHNITEFALMELSTATEFTPLLSLVGGILIGISALMVMGLFGRIAGISGITSGMMAAFLPMRGAPTDLAWRLAFVAGLIAAPLLYSVFAGQMPAQTVPTSLIGMAIAGIVVGVGTSLGSGCTSGHGVCGLARLSPRSLIAVCTFMATAGVTVFVLRHMV
jgi:uncharacterized protein